MTRGVGTVQVNFRERLGLQRSGWWVGRSVGSAKAPSGTGMASPGHIALPRSFRSPQFNGTVLNWIINRRDAVIPSPNVASLRFYLAVVHLSSFS